MKAKPSTVLCTCKHAYIIIHTYIHTRLHKCIYVKRMFIFINYVCSWSFTQDPNTVVQTTCTTGSAGK